MRLAVPVTLAALSLLLLGGIAYETIAPLDPVVVAVPRITRNLAPSPVRIYAPQPVSDFADIDARPVFNAARKPLPEAEQATALTASSDFTLAGVIMDTNRAVALIRSQSTNTTTSAVLGDAVSGWRVVKIDPTAVTLRANGSDAVIGLEGPAARPAGAAIPRPQMTPASPPPAPPPTAATTPAIIPSAPPAPPSKPPGYHPYINPDALRGAVINPQTGEPEL